MPIRKPGAASQNHDARGKPYDRLCDNRPMEAVSAAEAPAAAGVEVTVDRWVRGTSVHTTDRVAEEVPVALLYNGEPHVVMLATPQDLEDLARGFSLSEELVDSAQEIRGIEV